MAILQKLRKLRAALQADQEAGTSAIRAVTPAVQQFHPSAAKCWAYVTVSAGTPTIAASYNITSITDTGVGILTITIGTDFSSANWPSFVTGQSGSTNTVQWVRTKAAGSIEIRNLSDFATLADPDAWNFVGYGDQ